MKIFKSILTTLVGIFLLITSGPALSQAALMDYAIQGTLLSDAPDYDWWYGCSPTSAGMMMGHYDINGYDGLRYDHLVPDGEAELSTYGGGTYLANNIIASAGHINDFYSGYLKSRDDTYSGREFDSLADFMGTSQDTSGNSNGFTSFWYYPTGDKLYDYNLPSYLQDYDGMYGIGEYITYRGYAYTNLYTQLTNNVAGAGFTFTDYMAEIDAGRVVMLHVLGHSMFGYGYDSDGTVYLHDTWSEGPDSMTWGQSYHWRTMWGVTCFTLSGGTAVPVPATVWLFGAGLAGLAGIRRKAFN